ncbi:unnamed protein product [Gadus morhua 'NCC']
MAVNTAAAAAIAAIAAASASNASLPNTSYKRRPPYRSDVGYSISHRAVTRALCAYQGPFIKRSRNSNTSTTSTPPLQSHDRSEELPVDSADSENPCGNSAELGSTWNINLHRCWECSRVSQKAPLPHVNSKGPQHRQSIMVRELGRNTERRRELRYRYEPLTVEMLIDQ